MVVNFIVRRISQSARKLTQTITLIKKISKRKFILTENITIHRGSKYLETQIEIFREYIYMICLSTSL
jgi:hypothetical protein